MFVFKFFKIIFKYFLFSEILSLHMIFFFIFIYMFRRWGSVIFMKIKLTNDIFQFFNGTHIYLYFYIFKLNIIYNIEKYNF